MLFQGRMLNLRILQKSGKIFKINDGRRVLLIQRSNRLNFLENCQLDLAECKLGGCSFTQKRNLDLEYENEGMTNMRMSGIRHLLNIYRGIDFS